MNLYIYITILLNNGRYRVDVAHTSSIHPHELRSLYIRLQAAELPVNSVNRKQ